jgi:DNA-binding MarR family transcriptional regulator/GNAT superfamily N-acetyltransferase
MDDIDGVRDFNRFYTRELGLLARSYLGSGLGVAEVRVLYELAQGAGAEARGLARTLGLDEGYLSRVLTRFEKNGWLRRRAAEGDARRRTLGLTEEGRAAMIPLEARSRAEIAARLAPLSAAAREELLRAMAAVRHHLVTSDAEIPVAIRQLGPGDAGWVVQRHAELYGQEERYDSSFEALVADIVARFLNGHDPEREGGWIAWQGARRVGSVFVVRDSNEVARLRLVLIEPNMRRQGLGHRLLDVALGFARDRGYRRMTLWTHESHRAAGALYVSTGFRMIEARSNRCFGQDVVDQVWERQL